MIYLIVFLGFILRATGVFNIVLIPGSDLFRDWNLAGRIVKTGAWPLVGPAASVNGNFHLGPFFYYLLSVPRFFWSDHRGAIIFFSLISSASIYVLYSVCQSWFSKRFSLIIAVFYTFSCYFIIVGNSPWNPYIMPSLTITALFSLIKIKEGKTIFLPVIFTIFGLMLQSHATALFLIPVFLLLLPLKKISVANFLFASLFFLFSLLPWLTANFECGFCEVKEGLNIFSISRAPEECNFQNWWLNHGHGESCFSEIRNPLFVFRLFSQSFFYSAVVPFVFLMAAMTLYVLWKAKIDENTKRTILVWLTIPTVFFLFYSSNVHLHYFLIYFPLPFFIMALFLEKVEKKFKKGKLIVNATVAFFIFINLTQYFIVMQTPRG